MNRKITLIAAAIACSIVGSAHASLSLADALGGSSSEAIAFRQWVLDNHKIDSPVFDYSKPSETTFVDTPTTYIGNTYQTAHNLLDNHNYDLQNSWIPQFESYEAEIDKQTVTQPDQSYANKHTGTPQYVVNTDTSKPVYYGETHRPNTTPDVNYANKHTGTPQYVVNTDTSKPVYYGETHRPNTTPDVNYANKHTGTPQYVVNTNTSKPVYYGETHRPNTSTAIVVSRNTTTAPIATTTNTESDRSQIKQINKKQLFILNTMADIAHYNAQQFNADNRNIAENHRHSAENSAAIRANSQRLDSVEQHQTSQDSRIDENKKQASAGISAAFAQANIPQVTENQQFAVGAGVGGYDNENAIAVGASFHATSNSVVKLTVSDDSQDNVGYGAGVSVGW
uniref:YadA C-terminal domain-containing protein n=1 Tax=Hafnia alvei TaxID=569 RepID=UPI0026ED3E67|nr:YadA C-terminal domain-containing protein [Hafnia alvei]